VGGLSWMVEKDVLVDIVANKLDEEERLVIALVFY
jgi:hypothetical protein